MQEIYIGIDGGGTKCKVRVENSSGELIGQALGGPANIRLSVDNSWDSIYSALNEALQQGNISLQDNNKKFHACMGLAGCEVPAARKNFLSQQHPFTTLELLSDAHTACIGAHAGNDGAIIIIGTGVVGYQIESGHETKVGGWGFPHDDEGGGAWFGLEVIRLTLQWVDKRIDGSPLLKEIYAHFRNNLSEMVSWAHHANSTEFASLAPFVIDHVNQGDHWAKQLMQRSATAINLLSDGMERSQRHSKLLSCSLFGGLTTFIEPYLADRLRARIVPRQHDANVGAIYFLKEKLIHAK